ncbi:MAG: hypothetical protein ACRD1M_07360 [Terriglobales bacterium]
MAYNLISPSALTFEIELDHIDHWYGKELSLVPDSLAHLTGAAPAPAR